MRLAFALCIAFAVPLMPANARAQSASFQERIAGAEVRSGVFDLYQKDGDLLLAIPRDMFERSLIWYAEVSRYPTDAVAFGGNALGARLIQLERRPDRIMVRSLSGTSFEKVSGDPYYTGGRDKLRPVNLAVERANLGPIIVDFPILAESDTGAVLVDLQEVFGGDIAGYSVAAQLASTGLAPGSNDPDRSYVAEASVYPDNLFVRSQLTFEATDQVGLAQPISLETAHSIAVLPETPMERRPYDDRVGFFFTEYLVFESAFGDVQSRDRAALRFRLEHADPDAPRPSDPVEPIVFYLSREIPDRWRPYIRQAVEDWQTAFEAAGFTNAIIARDAPSRDEVPGWSPEDVRHSVIRWVAQPVQNAMGPNIHDPRSGEILSAHILVWPDVLNLFSRYYYLLMHRTDPAAAKLPLPEELQGRILRYVVSHEVGHTLGLRHNHRASTAWSTAQLRDPLFTAENGSTSSIMAYGRFNYVAEPDDGVTQLIPIIGSYDRHAIRWGYSSDVDAEELDSIAAEAEERPELIWGAGERGEEYLAQFDHRVQTENIGADRILATRAGIAALHASLAALPLAVEDARNPQAMLEETYGDALNRYVGIAGSVGKLIGGVTQTSGDDRPFAYVDPEQQRRAVEFLTGEAINGLSAFADPDLLGRFRPVGGLISVENAAAQIMDEVLNRKSVRMVYMQRRLLGDTAMSLQEYVSLVTETLLSDLPSKELVSPAQNGAIIAYIDILTDLTTEDGNAEDLVALVDAEYPLEVAMVAVGGLKGTSIGEIASAELDRVNAMLGKGLSEQGEEEQ
ncbi:zinc-dependent metalloprotease [uncultured Ruegeria sp.]|uniref:zinc-dependent metalloprotease n=1 Tax=uncultured Ruegeria sp. TaxID=259304 RepID=UPI00261E5058|nr:zinc-dependent metalloprotease [uncultured Ruegeria sp.]